MEAGKFITEFDGSLSLEVCSICDCRSNKEYIIDQCMLPEYNRTRYQDAGMWAIFQACEAKVL